MTAITFRRVLARYIKSLGDGITQGKTRYFRTDIWPLNFSSHWFFETVFYFYFCTVTPLKDEYSCKVLWKLACNHFRWHFFFPFWKFLLKSQNVLWRLLITLFICALVRRHKNSVKQPSLKHLAVFSEKNNDCHYLQTPSGSLYHNSVEGWIIQGKISFFLTDLAVTF